MNLDVVFLMSLFSILIFIIIKIFYELNKIKMNNKMEDKIKDIFEDINNNFNNKILEINKNMNDISDRIDMNVSKGLIESNSSIKQLMTRIECIDNVQKHIHSLSTNIVSLNDILTDKKIRGIYGEVQLVNIFKNIFGDNKKIYKCQHKLSNNNIVDLMVFMSDNPQDHLSIDSKFPLDNYRKLSICKDKKDFQLYERKFKSDLKKHIDNISDKYIICEETSDHALMFIPAESIFSFINDNYIDIVDYGYRKKILLVSPTTLMSILNTIQYFIKDRERDRYANLIKDELISLSEEFKRYIKRWDSLNKDINKVYDDIKDINNTNKKITNKFQRIENSEIVIK